MTTCATEPSGQADQQFLTVAEAAAQLRVGESAVYKAIRSRRLGACCMRRTLRIPAAEVAAFRVRHGDQEGRAS